MNLKEMSLEQLADLIRGQIDEAHSFKKKTCLELFRAGAALVVARDRQKRSYGKWLEDNKIARTTAHEATTLFTRAKTEKAIEGMTMTSAKLHFGVIKPKAKKKKDQNPNEAKKRTALDLMQLVCKAIEECKSLDRIEADAEAFGQLAQSALSNLVAVNYLHGVLVNSDEKEKVA